MDMKLQEKASHKKIRFDPTPAILYVPGHAGHTETPVTVVGVTNKYYRIIAEKVTRLSGQMKFLHPGQEAMVPKRDIRMGGG